MVELSEILDSKEMKDVIKAINALKRKYLSNHYETDRPWPIALALVGRYNAKFVLELLLNDKQYYPGYKDILAASFCGWLIAPRTPRVRETLMIQAALSHMNSAEVNAGFLDTDFTIEADIAARYLFTGTDFLVEIYDCLGGYKAFLDAPTYEDIWDAFKTVEKVINTTSRAIAYLHHATDRFCGSGRTFTPSLNKAVHVLDVLKENDEAAYKEKYVSRSLLHERWSQNKQTLALIYAASTIRVHRNTLLKLILSGFFEFSIHGKFLKLWVGRARYTATHIFGKMDDHNLLRSTKRLLGEGDAIAFSPPKLDEWETASFDKIFRNFIR